MNAKNLLGKLSLITLITLVTAQSCKKENGIDNNNVLQKPYTVYASDAKGNVIKTNDGDNYETVFPGDGTPLRAIITSKMNLLIVKDKTVFISENEGKTFNPLEFVLVPQNIKWSNFILNVSELDRVYVSNLQSIRGKVSISPENGTYFNPDTSWSASDTPYIVESFTYLDNNILCGFSGSGSVFGTTSLYYKTGKDEVWKPRSNSLPSPNNFYLSHSGSTLIATDFDGNEGSWYSNDTGKTFKQYTGIPNGKILYRTYSAFQKLLIGMQDNGLYLYDNSKFVPSNSGIDPKTTVYDITSKENYYKNDVSKQFFYIATSTGIYKSEDYAKSWVKVKKGDYRIIY